MQIISKSLLDIKEGLIVHQVNNRGVMRSGIAKDIREAYPKAYELYMKRHLRNLLDMGTVFGHWEIQNKFFVANLIGQDGYGRDGKQYTSYEALQKGFIELDKFAHNNNLQVYIPFKMGCGLGGGDWTIVSHLIDTIIPDAIVCKLNKAMPVDRNRYNVLVLSGQKKILECSSKGDKRFSAFYARVKAFGIMASIEDHYQLVKRFPEVPHTCRDAKGKKPTHICINSHDLHADYLSEWYASLWIKYLDEHPELVKYAQEFDDFHDMFRGKSVNCQADMIRIYVKEGRSALIKQCSRLWTIMRNWRD